jgi:hypothetical protein
MSVHDVQPAVGSPSVPRPRSPEPDAVDRPAVGEAIGTDISARRPALPRWSEPSSARARPSTQYWDVTTASWRSRR